MDIQKLIHRSKQSFEDDPKKIGCEHVEDPLVAVEPTLQLTLDPIWNHASSDIEGGLYREYIKTNPAYDKLWLRQEVVERLNLASQSLPANLTLVLKAGQRPMEVQRKEIKLNMQKFLEHNKGATQQDALIHARTFIDDPEVKLPSHCCGSAVDVDVFDRNTNMLVDFGCPINTATETAYIHTDSISEHQKNNRLILLRAMLTAGFAPTFVEWWHFSYGDSVWAYFYDLPKSLYGPIEPAL